MSRLGVTGTARGLLGALGVGLGLWGLWLLLHSLSGSALLRLPLWLGGAVLVDDFFLIPITVAVGWALARWSAGRRPVRGQSVDPQASGGQPIDPQVSGGQSIDPQASGGQSIDRQVSGGQSGERGPVGRRWVGRPSIGGRGDRIVSVVRTILLYVGLTTVVALPLLLRQGDSANLTVLPRNYWRDWLLLEACIVLGGVVWLLIATALRSEAQPGVAQPDKARQGVARPGEPSASDQE